MPGGAVTGATTVLTTSVRAPHGRGYFLSQLFSSTANSMHRGTVSYGLHYTVCSHVFSKFSYVRSIAHYFSTSMTFPTVCFYGGSKFVFCTILLGAARRRAALGRGRRGCGGVVSILGGVHVPVQSNLVVGRRVGWEGVVFWDRPRCFRYF